MAVVLADLLIEEHVKLELAAGTRDKALREIVALLRGPTNLSDSEQFLTQVIAREEVHTTLMSRAVAFPHARTELVERLILGIGRSRAGVVFGENDARAHLIFLVGVPRRLVTDYLVCVGGLARLVNDDAIREVLMNTDSVPEFLEALRKGSLVLE